jgi:MerR family redox-sensitive transcriptional activator SoxR
MDTLTIGELAARSGLAPSALRYYEDQGLLVSTRTTGGQRRYARSALRRVAVVQAAQRVGMSLSDVRDAMADLPPDRAPNAREWARLSRRWRGRLDQRIAELQRLRDDLSGCIGCGCLSLRRCALYNPGDVAATRGPGPRRLLGDAQEREAADG